MFALRTQVRIQDVASPAVSQGPARETASIQALERGLAVIEVFSQEHPALTLSEVAQLTGTTRATARRILITLERLGHVRSDGRRFALTARVLSLGWAYLSSLNLTEIAQPFMRELVVETGESTSVATLDIPEIVYVARVPTQRIMSITLGIGTRLPAHATSMGRVLLAALPDEDLTEFLDTTTLDSYTQRTIVDPAMLRRVLATVAGQGWAMVDQELEMGLRSVAAPLRGPDGRTVAALNISAAAARVSTEELRGRFLPALLETANAISTALGQKGLDTAERAF
jgi:IclR family pca regulon transcriptional regulator